MARPRPTCAPPCAPADCPGDDARRGSAVDAQFRAFADLTRLRLLGLLHAVVGVESRHGELCVCDLIDVLALPQAKISRHLGVLRRAGLVVSRKQGTWRYYRLAAPGGAFHAKLIECLACCAGCVTQMQADARRLGLIADTDACCGPAGPPGNPDAMLNRR